MKSSKLLSVLTALAAALLVLSGSIAVPILCRPFYYAHIEAMSLPEYTGLTVDQIKQAFDEMLDFCLGLRQDFSVGVLSWSESGRDHFADVRVLFQLDLVLLVLSAAALLAAVLMLTDTWNQIHQPAGRPVPGGAVPVGLLHRGRFHRFHLPVLQRAQPGHHRTDGAGPCAPGPK